MSTSSCLITGDPVAYEPERTPPIILPSGLEPDPRQILILGGGDEASYRLPIKARILSEDAGQRVRTALYVDYGYKNVLGKPYRDVVPFNALQPGTLSDGGRSLVGVEFAVDPGDESLKAGCHRLTLVASHEFDDATLCPMDLSDSTQVTWHFILCKPGLPCTDTIGSPDTLEGCPPIEATCPEQYSQTTGG